MSQYEKEESSDRYSLRGKVFHQLREDILSGHYKEHEELREMAISEEMGVSRTPVREALRHIVGVQFRNGATLGGSLWRRMGFSDIVALFMAMDSYVELFGGGIVSLEEFVGMKYDKDLLVRLIVKKQPGAFAYQAVRKQRTDLPSLNCAAAKLGDEYRVVVGSRPARAMILRDDQCILANGITEESAAFAEYAANTVPVSGNMWGSAEYRKALVPVLTRRTLMALGEVL